MELLNFSFIILFCLFLIIILQQNELIKARKRIVVLEKRLSGNLTDFEKLKYIIELYKNIAFKVLRPDQLTMWGYWVTNRFIKFKNMTQFALNDKPAVKLNANVLYNGKNNLSIKFDCDGDIVWLPKKCIQINEDDTILLEEWLYNQKVTEGKL